MDRTPGGTTPSATTGRVAALALTVAVGRQAGRMLGRGAAEPSRAHDIRAPRVLSTLEIR